VIARKGSQYLKKQKGSWPKDKEAKTLIHPHQITQTPGLRQSLGRTLKKKKLLRCILPRSFGLFPKRHDVLQVPCDRCKMSVASQSQVPTGEGWAALPEPPTLIEESRGTGRRAGTLGDLGPLDLFSRCEICAHCLPRDKPRRTDGGSKQRVGCRRDLYVDWTVISDIDIIP
jgi:hypothetical protein